MKSLNLGHKFRFIVCTVSQVIKLAYCFIFGHKFYYWQSVDIANDARVDTDFCTRCGEFKD